MFLQSSKQRNIEKIKDLIIVLLLILPLLLFIYIYPNHWMGWFILALTYALPFFMKPFRNNKSWIITTFFILTVHHAVAFINSYFGPTFGAEKDALRFDREASLFAQYYNSLDFSLGSDLYVNFLAGVYKIFGDSKLLGSELSVLAFLLSLFVILKIASFINKDKYISAITLLYGILPTVFLYTSVTLREPFQMLFFSLTLYYGLKFMRYKGLGNLTKIIISLFLMGIWHNGLMAAAPFILLIIVFFSLDGKKLRFTKPLKFMLFCFSVAFVFGSFYILTKLGFSTAASQALFSGDALSYSGTYAKVEYAGGSTYGANLDTSSLFSIITTLPQVFINYMFAPFPWQIRGFMDLYAAFESLLRFLLLYFAWKSYRNSGGELRNNYKFMLLVFLFIELVWATGTQNWGTAMRHHLIAYGIILVMGIDGFLKRRNTGKSDLPQKRKKIRKRIVW